MFAAWWLHPTAISDRMIPLEVLAGLEITRYVFDLAKFGREASYHMWSSEAWGVALFIGFFSLLTLGTPGLPVSIAIYIGIAADMEGLAISIVLPGWKTDVPTLFHALSLQRAKTYLKFLTERASKTALRFGQFKINQFGFFSNNLILWSFLFIQHVCKPSSILPLKISYYTLIQLVTLQKSIYI
jgi:hypothetical protein